MTGQRYPAMGILLEPYMKGNYQRSNEQVIFRHNFPRQEFDHESPKAIHQHASRRINFYWDECLKTKNNAIHLLII